jgi:hypothetical protein
MTKAVAINRICAAPGPKAKKLAVTKAENAQISRAKERVRTVIYKIAAGA